jgi:hypothetical protein
MSSPVYEFPPLENLFNCLKASPAINFPGSPVDDRIKMLIADRFASQELKDQQVNDVLYSLFFTSMYPLEITYETAAQITQMVLPVLKECATQSQGYVCL